MTIDKVKLYDIAEKHKISCKELGLRCCICLTSIGGSPIHIGHINVLKLCDKLEPSLVILAVNSDDYAIKKHGYAFQKEQERLEILDNMKGVDYTYLETDSDLCNAIYAIRPDFLVKGGDRDPASMNKDEIKCCLEMDSNIVYGGEKVQSSSQLLEDYYQFRRKQEPPKTIYANGFTFDIKYK